MPKYKKIECGCSNIQHGDHDQMTIENTSDSKFNTNCTNENEIYNNNSTNSINNMWVRNISSTPLTKAQVKVLSHGPNFVVVPRCPPVGKYIAHIEEACTQLKLGKQKN